MGHSLGVSRSQQLPAATIQPNVDLRSGHPRLWPVDSRKRPQHYGENRSRLFEDSPNGIMGSYDEWERYKRAAFAPLLPGRFGNRHSRYEASNSLSAITCLIRIAHRLPHKHSMIAAAHDTKTPITMRQRKKSPRNWQQ